MCGEQCGNGEKMTTLQYGLSISSIILIVAAILFIIIVAGGVTFLVYVINKKWGHKDGNQSELDSDDRYR